MFAFDYFDVTRKDYAFQETGNIRFDEKEKHQEGAFTWNQQYRINSYDYVIKTFRLCIITQQKVVLEQVVVSVPYRDTSRKGVRRLAQVEIKDACSSSKLTCFNYITSGYKMTAVYQCNRKETSEPGTTEITTRLTSEKSHGSTSSTAEILKTSSSWAVGSETISTFSKQTTPTEIRELMGTRNSAHFIYVLCLLLFSERIS